MRTAIGLFVWAALSAGYWLLFATAIPPFLGREGGGQHLMSLLLALAVWLLLSGLLAWALGGRRRPTHPE